MVAKHPTAPKQPNQPNSANNVPKTTNSPLHQPASSYPFLSKIANNKKIRNV